MAHGKNRELAWYKTLIDQEQFLNSQAKLSLIKRGVDKPTDLQLRLETLLLSHKSLKNTVFLGNLSEKELICLTLTAWGVEAKEIAAMLYIEKDSVHKIHARICKKLNAKNVPNAVFKADEAEFLTIDNIDYIVDFILEFKNKNKYLSKINKETTVNKIDDLRNNTQPSYSNNNDFISDTTLPSRSHHE
ncbi:helix-turn-helix transcriptional regulator [Rickettsiella endosymbiont of Dermanyssus gallinae]|uniref:helix-turn-helix transcriptional regulator n=1 Tax=Rickettsiella endosymbiont of Dermanyssus gallinae TaxID=2856608 RepID=UPI001C53106E|nr:LuxR C-terminal-related transcriptional regulator [Rickettsiella endosymbiont of Dermanyssus gallinae]